MITSIIAVGENVMVDYTVHLCRRSGSTIDLDRADTAGILGEQGMAYYIVREGLVGFLQEHGLAVVSQRP